MGFQFECVTYLVLVPFICIFGVAGNALTLLVLVRGRFGGGAFVYLKGLAVFDLLSLVFVLPICLVRCPTCRFQHSHLLAVYEAYVYICVGDIFLKASVWTTVLLTVERCLVIVFRRKWTVSTRKSRFPRRALVAIFLFTAAENLPTVFAYSVDRGAGEVTLTQYGRSVWFEAYSWLDAVLFQLLPLVVLFTFNIALGRHLLHHRRHRRRLKVTAPRSFTQHRHTAERRTLLLLLGIVGLFLATMVPCCVMQLVGVGLQYGSPLYSRLQAAVTLLVSLNFAANFLLYCLLHRRFSRTATTLLCSWRCRQNQVKANQVTPDQVTTNQVMPNQVMTNQVAPNQITPNQATQNQVAPDQIRPFHIAFTDASGGCVHAEFGAPHRGEREGPGWDPVCVCPLPGGEGDGAGGGGVVVGVKVVTVVPVRDAG